MREKNSDLIEKIFHVHMLLHRYHGYHFKAFGPFSNPLRGQGRVLSILKMQPQISQKELSYLLDMRQQSLSELLAKLENKGLIRRAPSEDDRRVTMITLTEEGKNAAPDAEEEEFCLENIFDCLSKEEKESFEEYLDRIADSLKTKFETADLRGYGKRGHGRSSQCHFSERDFSCFWGRGRRNE